MALSPYFREFCFFNSLIAKVRKEYEVGFALSKELFEDLKKLHPKMHIMTANNFSLAKELLQ